MNWDEKSDFEVNKQLAGLIHGEDWWHKNNGSVFILRLMPTDSGGYETRKAVVDYCNNWADIGPLIEEHGINLEPLFSGGWYAGKVKTYTFEEEPLEFQFDTCDKNPKRAAAICIIKLL